MVMLWSMNTLGINVTCDCCQKPAQEVTEVGFVNKAYYCSECLPLYEDYRKQVDDFHTEMAKQVTTGLEDIKQAWLTKHGGTLPE